MYRLFLSVLLCLKAASSAPQAKESDVTYVKIHPLVADTPVDTASSVRESRIEKLPLTIPGNISNSDRKEPDKNPTEYLESNRSDNLSASPSNLSENKSISSENKSVNKSELSENLQLSESNQPDRLLDASGTDESNTTDGLSEIRPTEDLSESDNVPSETKQSDRRARNFDSGDTTEITEEATVKYEDELEDHTTIEEPRTRASPKFVPKVPKLSYFQKPRVFQSYSSNNLDLAGTRRFRSRCTCQKIWNCPKLQITVPRCPDEYFLCCF